MDPNYKPATGVDVKKHGPAPEGSPADRLTEWRAQQEAAKTKETINS
jgi:hypothetical protein|tara:strand:- start:596 stop:736 length:141 start_codon:yes stop_codon:yes gene_type:complete